MKSWIFSIITPSFSVTSSFRNHSNMLHCLIWFWKFWFFQVLKEQHLF